MPCVLVPVVISSKLTITFTPYWPRQLRNSFIYKVIAFINSGTPYTHIFISCSYNMKILSVFSSYNSNHSIFLLEILFSLQHLFSLNAFSIWKYFTSADSKDYNLSQYYIINVLHQPIIILKEAILYCYAFALLLTLKLTPSIASVARI